MAAFLVLFTVVVVVFLGLPTGFLAGAFGSSSVSLVSGESFGSLVSFVSEESFSSLISADSFVFWASVDSSLDIFVAASSVATFSSSFTGFSGTVSLTVSFSGSAVIAGSVAIVVSTVFAAFREIVLFSHNSLLILAVQL